LQKHDVRKRGKFETYLYKLPSKIVSNPIRSQTDFQNFAWKTWKIVGDDTQNSPHDYEYICFISRFFVFKQNYRNLQDGHKLNGWNVFGPDLPVKFRWV
jgi:hypothetical protein